MVRIAIVVGSTRPGRRADQVARWVDRVAVEWSADASAADVGDTAETATNTRRETRFELVDLADFDLPLLDEPVPAAIGDYRNPHTRRWASTIESYDGFVFITPEYNHSVPAALKNAIDYLFAEWNDKSAGFVSYGLTGGTRAVEHLRLALAEVKVADVRSQVALSLFADFEIADMSEPGQFTPGDHQEQLLIRLLDEVCAWARALQPLRTPAIAPPSAPATAPAPSPVGDAEDAVPAAPR